MEASHLAKALRHALGGLSGPDPASDALLLERFVAQHDEGAFTALVQRHGPMVLRLSQRMLANPTDAEDVFQATFVVLARRAASIVKRPSLASWLHGVARRIARDVRRSASRRQGREQSLGAAAEAIADRGTPAAVSASDLRPILDEELGHLPERYRAPLVLYYLEGRSADEVATELGLVHGTVASRMSRGRDLLRKRLSKRGLALSAAALTAQLESTAGAAVPVATLHALTPAGFVAGTGIRDGATILAKEALQSMFWSKARWAGALLACVLVFSTATVKWAASTPKPAAANSSTEPREDFYVRWRFDSGPPKDIRVIGGQWKWVAEAGKPKVMFAPDVTLVLPTRVPKQPFVLSIKVLRPAKSPTVQFVGPFWADVDARRVCPPRQWATRKDGQKFPGNSRRISAYFMGRWSVASVPDTDGKPQVRRVDRYANPYPGQGVVLRMKNAPIEEIELRSLRSEEIPPPLRSPEKTIQAMAVIDRDCIWAPSAEMTGGWPP